MLKISNLLCSKGKFNLSVEDLELQNTGLVLVQGPNGAGKSTFLKCISGINEYRGKIKFKDVDLSAFNFKQRARLVGYMPQNIDVSDQLVLDFLILGRLPYTNFLNHYSDKDWEIVYHISSIFDLTKMLNRRLNTLSEGELQRVLLCKLFIQSPEVLLLDEPTSSLDVEFKVMIRDFIEEFIKLYPNKLVIVASHEPWFFSKNCKDLLIVKDGILTKQEGPDQFFDKEKVLAMLDM